MTKNSIGLIYEISLFDGLQLRAASGCVALNCKPSLDTEHKVFAEDCLFEELTIDHALQGVTALCAQHPFNQEKILKDSFGNM